MSPNNDTKEKTEKPRSTTKFDNLSTALKKNLQRRKKIQKEKNANKNLASISDLTY